jgi:hypothetical protein
MYRPPSDSVRPWTTVSAAAVLMLFAGCGSLSRHGASTLRLEAESPPWAGDSPVGTTLMMTRQRFGADGYDTEVRWLSADGKSYNAADVIRRIASFLRGSESMRLVFLRNDIQDRYTSAALAPPPERPVRAGSDYGWHLVAIDPIVLIGMAAPIQFEATEIALTPFGVAAQRGDGILFGFGVFASSAVPVMGEPFWCSPTFGIEPRRATLDADGRWYINLPGRRLELARDDSEWRVVASQRVDGPFRNEDGRDLNALTPVNGDIATETFTPPDSRLVGEWSGSRGTLHVTVRIDASGCGLLRFRYSMVAGEFERPIDDWSITASGAVRLAVRQTAGERRLRPAVWTGLLDGTALLVEMPPSLDTSPPLEWTPDSYRMTLRRAAPADAIRHPRSGIRDGAGLR